MKTDNEKFVDVNDICNNLPEKVRKLLPAYHSIASLDRTLYLFWAGKVKPFKKALKKDKIGFLQCFQNKEYKEMKPAEGFVQTIMCPGKDKSIAETRSWMYEKQNKNQVAI